MAARDRSVHLILSSMDQKGGARPRPKQHHPVPQGSSLSIKCLLATGSPQSIPIKTHSFLKAKTHTNTSRPFCHTAHTRARRISCVGGVTTHHCNHIRFKHRQLPSSPTVPSITLAYSASVIDMASPLTSCHAPIPGGKHCKCMASLYKQFYGKLQRVITLILRCESKFRFKKLLYALEPYNASRHPNSHIHNVR